MPGLFRREGEEYVWAASYGIRRTSSAHPGIFQTSLVLPERGSLIGRAALEGKPSHIPDVFADPNTTGSKRRRSGGFRTIARRAALARGRDDRCRGADALRGAAVHR